MRVVRQFRGAWHQLPRPLAFLLLAVPAQAGITLVPPIDCQFGPDCFIQNHVDHDPGPGFQDFACGHLGYDGHTGTDFALGSLAQMVRGVDVLAPAAGRVRAIRDGMPDIAFNVPGAPALDGRDCGNAVVIDHAGGYSSQLCHLAQGSVRVRSGDQVVAGQPLGRVGLSGRSEFPHVHLTVRQGDRVIDPFRPAADNTTCDIAPGAGLWAEPLIYLPTRIIGLGFTTAAPDPAQDPAESPAAASLPGDAPALVFWVRLLGPATGDQLVLRLTGPRGILAEQSETLTRNQARALRFVGRRLPPGGWPPGLYRAEVTLTRKGTAIDRQARDLTIRLSP